MESSVQRAEGAVLSPEDEEELELDLDDPEIDEAGLPPIDMDDAEALGQDAGYGDLLDTSWLDRTAAEEPEDDRATLDDIGLTIELDDSDMDDDAQVVDLDVGSLLTSLPSEGTELDLDSGAVDGALAIAALRDVLLPSDDEVNDDREIGDDDRFPAFDDASDIEPRPSLDDTDDDVSSPEHERPRNDDLT